MSKPEAKRARLLGASGPSSVKALRRRHNVQDAPPVAAEVVPCPEKFREATPVCEMLRCSTRYQNHLRVGEHLHVSDLIGKCVRMFALLDKFSLAPPVEFLADGQTITFAIGDAIHDFVKKKFIENYSEAVWAVWSCACGKTKEGPGFLRDRKQRVCTHCGLPVDQHNEPGMLDGEHPVSGAPDLILWIEECKAFLIVEIKSIAKKGFDELLRPVPDHKVQVSYYWRLLKQAGMPLLDVTSILYVTKEWTMKNPYKEFLIEQPQETMLEPYVEDAKSFGTYKKTGELPPRLLCPTVDAPAAKKCPVVMQCFSETRRQSNEHSSDRPVIDQTRLRVPNRRER